MIQAHKYKNGMIVRMSNGSRRNYQSTRCHGNQQHVVLRRLQDQLAVAVVVAVDVLLRIQYIVLVSGCVQLHPISGQVCKPAADYKC